MRKRKLSIEELQAWDVYVAAVAGGLMACSDGSLPADGGDGEYLCISKYAADTADKMILERRKRMT